MEYKRDCGDGDDDEDDDDDDGVFMVDTQTAFSQL